MAFLYPAIDSTSANFVSAASGLDCNFAQQLGKDIDLGACQERRHASA